MIRARIRLVGRARHAATPACSARPVPGVTPVAAWSTRWATDRARNV